MSTNAIKWTIEQFEKMGFRLQPNQQHALIHAWKDHVKAEKNEAKVKKDDKASGSIDEAPIDGKETGGFTTGL